LDVDALVIISSDDGAMGSKKQKAIDCDVLGFGRRGEARARVGTYKIAEPLCLKYGRHDREPLGVGTGVARRDVD
jgi:hypothetical protein